MAVRTPRLSQKSIELGLHLIQGHEDAGAELNVLFFGIALNKLDTCSKHFNAVAQVVSESHHFPAQSLCFRKVTLEGLNDSGLRSPWPRFIQRKCGSVWHRRYPSVEFGLCGYNGTYFLVRWTSHG